MALDYKKLKVGQLLEPFQKAAVDKVQLVKYAGASGDFNPLHTDDAFAQKIGLDGVIAHGMLIMGFLGQYVNELAGNNAEINSFNMRFGAMTVPGDSIVCSGKVVNIYEEDGVGFIQIELKADVAPIKVWRWSESKQELITDIIQGKTVGTGEAILRFR